MNSKILRRHLRTLMTLTLLLGTLCTPGQTVGATPAPPVRRMHVPYWTYPDFSIFWFGQVTPTTNYADVRMKYDPDNLRITLHVVDRLLYTNPTPSLGDLTAWDAVSIYLNPNRATGNQPGTNAYHFTAQLWATQAGDKREAGYQWNGANWITSTVPFTVTTAWRGNSPNDNVDDKGWEADFVIPFASLGVSTPITGTTWGLALRVHDRDDANGTTIPVLSWPQTVDTQKPATWGQLSFGMPVYQLPLAAPGGDTTIRQGVNGGAVADADVGGHTTCGANVDHWSQWGETTYPHNTQVNIQNQWDVADYPCFSKYFVTFPLDSVPTGKTIISATVTLYLFGNAGLQPGEARPSFIQALTVADDWTESLLTWNNAPAATENLGGTWVDPVDFFNPGVPYQWDVSQSVATAYTQQTPLRLAFYSADGAYHSGKYFWSSDAAENVRPLLQVRWGNPVSTTEQLYLPLIHNP